MKSSDVFHVVQSMELMPIDILFIFLIRLDYYHRLYYLLFAMSQDELLFQLTRCHLIIHKGYQEKI